jgi:hypothetical protein
LTINGHSVGDFAFGRAWSPRWDLEGAPLHRHRSGAVHAGANDVRVDLAGTVQLDRMQIELSFAAPRRHRAVR